MRAPRYLGVPPPLPLYGTYSFPFVFFPVQAREEAHTGRPRRDNAIPEDFGAGDDASYRMRALFKIS
jgi:hypothetical protein